MDQPPPIADAWQLVQPGTPNPELAQCVAAWDMIRRFHGPELYSAVFDMIAIQNEGMNQ